MKVHILILLLFSVLCGIAQEDARKTSAAIKPSTTDCPTWNQKGKKISKAEYFRSLRSNKTKVNQQTAVNSNNNHSPKIQSNPVSQKNLNSNQRLYVNQTRDESPTEKNTALKLKNTEKSSTIVSHKNKTSKSISEEKLIIPEPEKKKTPSEEKKEPSTTVSDENKNEKIAEIKKEEKIEDKKNKRKLIRNSGKTIKVRKRNNAKCPSF